LIFLFAGDERLHQFHPFGAPGAKKKNKVGANLSVVEAVTPPPSHPPQGESTNT